MTPKELRALGTALAAPFSLELSGHGVVGVTTVLRLLPSRRLTARVRLADGGIALLKLFFAGEGNARYWQRELDGTRLLAANGIPTPALLGSDKSDAHACYVLYEFLDGAEPLATPDGSPAVDSAAAVAAFRLVGALHRQGLVHNDLHWQNFLMHRGTLYLVDGDAVRRRADGQALPTKTACQNLALMAAQFSLPPTLAELSACLSAYRQANPSFDATDRTLQDAVNRAYSRRLTAYLRKPLRNCSEFVVEKTPARFVALMRQEADWVAPLARDPDHWLAGGVALKRGHTATVARVRVGEREVVIKRYNIKNWRHAVSRAWRPSRAWHSWLAGHRLRFMGIATPKPLALIEERHGPFRGRAWLITDYAEGPSVETLLDHVVGGGESPLLSAIRVLFGKLVRVRLTHGDFKATNLIWSDGRLLLIDLDSLSDHASEAGFRRAWQKDGERFLRNWPTAGERAVAEALLPELRLDKSQPLSDGARASG